LASAGFCLLLLAFEMIQLFLKELYSLVDGSIFWMAAEEGQG
jgi:hypothetical protein